MKRESFLKKVGSLKRKTQKGTRMKQKLGETRRVWPGMGRGQVRNEPGGVSRRVLKWNARIPHQDTPRNSTVIT